LLSLHVLALFERLFSPSFSLQQLKSSKEIVHQLVKLECFNQYRSKRGFIISRDGGQNVADLNDGYAAIFTSHRQYLSLLLCAQTKQR